MKFKVGDKVKVSTKVAGYNGPPEYVIGEVGEVVSVEVPDYPYFVRLDSGNEMSFAENELEKVN